MALRNIVKDGDPILRKKCRPVTDFNERLHVLLDDMKDTLIYANGAGLAAPQVGIMRRVAIVSVDEDYFELINPEIIKTEGEETSPEGCLSIPGVCGTVSRPYKVTVKAQDRFGKEFTAKGEGLLARAFCHEIDHLDGILFKDKIIEYYEED
ncbi:MAG: peptide deformylase [Oscillospiraceae bacterium]|nr:peptide deformylase [Oscillospiraceae bacterium]